MKAESEKLKSRTSISMDDGDWSNVQKAAKASGLPLSQFIREAVNSASDKALDALAAQSRASGKGAK